jgi:hypothetical protein
VARHQDLLNCSLPAVRIPAWHAGARDQLFHKLLIGSGADLLRLRLKRRPRRRLERAHCLFLVRRQVRDYNAGVDFRAAGGQADADGFVL